MFILIKNFKMTSLVLLLFVSYLFNLCCSAPQCLDENGNAVDWFVLYKLPHIKGHNNYNIANGVGYVYITSDTVKSGWRLSDFNISDSRSIPGKTLDVAYAKIEGNDVNDLFWIVYNDQPPDRPFTRKDGHTKGIVVGSYNGGIWIVHSVPKFPIIDSEGYRYPATGCRYGQSFLCITLNKEELGHIGNQLIVNAANTYSYKFDGNLKNVYPSLFAAAIKERNDKVTNKLQFRSVKQVLFTSFAKSAKFGADLYSQWVAEELKSELLVETWLHEEKLPSNCSISYQTHNIQKIRIDPSACKFDNMNDHSKFVVSGQSKNPWVCIGDINHSTDQFRRAGGTVCFENKDLWKAYFSIVMAVEPCPT